RVVRVAAARPVAERHRRRHAPFARMDLAAVLGGEVAEVEEVDFDLLGDEGVLDIAREAERLRHLARAGAVVARRAADDERARRRRRVALRCLGALDPLARREPLDREVVVGVGVAGTGLARLRRLALVPIVVPGDLLDAAERIALAIEVGIEEELPEALAELLAAERRRRLPLAYLRHRGCLSRVATIPALQRGPTDESHLERRDGRRERRHRRRRRQPLLPGVEPE